MPYPQYQQFFSHTRLIPALAAAKITLQTQLQLKLLWMPAGCLAVSVALWLFLANYHAGFLALNQWTNAVFSAPAWQRITLMGDAYFMLALAACLIRLAPAFVWAITLGGVIQALLVNAIKHALQADRPAGVLDATQFLHTGPLHDWGSFPSGHTATAFLWVGCLLVLTRHWWLRVPLLLLGVLVGLSRVAVGVHWPLDIVAGAAVGLFCAGLGMWLAQRWQGGLSTAGYSMLAALLAYANYRLLTHDSGYPYADALMPILGGLGLAVLAYYFLLLPLWMLRQAK